MNLTVKTCNDCPFESGGMGCEHPMIGKDHEVHNEIDAYYYANQVSPPSCPLRDVPLTITKQKDAHEVDK